MQPPRRGARHDRSHPSSRPSSRERFPQSFPPREVIEHRLRLLGDRLAWVQGIIGTVLAAANQLEDRSEGADQETDLRCALEVANELLDALGYDTLLDC